MRQKTEDRRQKTERFRRGSAIILAIVLTTLLAIIGVLFLFSSRVDSIATSAVGGNEDLKLAVDTVVAQISEVLTHNVPGVDPNGTYYDYPDNFNPWLASLEPNYLGVWPHVTDLYYPQLGFSAYNLPANVIYEHGDPAANGIQADADGDGASDSMWVQIPGKMSAKGKPIYAAIRIIDNGGMLNVNTGYKFFDSNSVGSTQLDINLMALSWRPNNPLFPYNPAAENILLLARNPSNLPSYENDVIWQYGLPKGAYTPFDISDELELRYRFLVNQPDIDTRAEVPSLWELRTGSNFKSPADSGQLNKWFINASADTVFDVNYAYRHIATTYNMDRIIAPDGSKMFNINQASSSNFSNIIKLRDRIQKALEPNENYDANQIAVNLIDYIDTDSNVTYFVAPGTLTPYFGFERPCVYISEIAQNFYQPVDGDPNYNRNNPNAVYRSYAIELFKPYPEDDAPNGWKLGIDGQPPTITINSWTASQRFHVLANIDLRADIPIDDSNSNTQKPVSDIKFYPGSSIKLYRPVNGYGLTPVDSVSVRPMNVNGSNWMAPTSSSEPHSFERDVTINRCIRRVWDPNGPNSPTLGKMNNFVDTGTLMIQAHPDNNSLTNIGEIGQLLSRDQISIDKNSTEADVRLNLADPCVQNLFKYLTVMDPNAYTGDPNETRIKGRINTNTAPWFVIAQLPWVSYNTTNYDLARSIVNYRDTIRGPFKNIGELMNVGIINNDSNSLNRMDYYKGKAIPTPLATPTDCNGDAFEERDVIFDRISNLVTVRSDVFTAYILVRIGPSGPQKRVIAILDRSGVTPTGGKVKIVAIQQVPDPR